jgi:hypothetical protein
MKRNNGMRIIIDALIGTLRPVLYVVAFVMITFFVFSLMGMGMFGRKMSKCNDGDFVVFPQVKTSHFDGVITGLVVI